MIPIVLIDRPRRRNTLDYNSARELVALCEQLAADDEVRVVIMTGAGRSFFCCGREDVAGDLTGPWQVSPSRALAALEVPVMAAVNGGAFDLGLEIALACDIRIASNTATFGFPAVRKGVLPSDGGTQRLPRLIGRGRALEMILTGDSVSAAQALQMGLVDEVVAPDRLQDRVEELAAAFAHKAPVALKYAKEAVSAGIDLPLDQGLRLEGDLYLLLQTTADRAEGVRSFLAKRKPAFKGK